MIPTQLLLNLFEDYVLLRFVLYFILAYILLFVLDFFLLFGATPKIEGCFSVPGYPIVGNFYQVINNPSLVYSKWVEKYKREIFQIRLGVKRAVIVNSYEDIQYIWIKNAVAMNSRPMSIVFHNVVSITQGFTVGSTPAGISYKRKKKSISQSLNKLNITQMNETFNNETKYIIKKLILNNIHLQGPPSCNLNRFTRSKLSDMDLLPFIQLFVLRTSIYISYGISLDTFGVDKELAMEVLEVENNIMRFRSPLSNIEDYIPYLNRLPFSLNKEAAHFRERRDKYMKFFFQKLQNMLEQGNESAHNSVIGKLLMSGSIPKCINMLELQSICLTMVSAGLDNISLNLNFLLGCLSHPSFGYSLQKKAFSEMMQTYDNNVCKAWESVAHETRCNYVSALVKESLRLFTVLPLSLPRETTRTIYYKGMKIPPNTMVLMNAYYANHDNKMFQNPNDFIPERWLDPQTGELLDRANMNHLSFGAGSRMCSGNHLAYKEMYVFIARMMLMFKIRRPLSEKFLMSLDPFQSNAHPKAISFEPKVFQMRLEPRQNDCSDKLYYQVLK